ncbi:epoxide hydrolase N-terminal domain-containing protein [Chitinophaga varians]|uniref:epoxide hydrolase N-terminal domain-containing protein n=1 Tax=Chitinophaga varians TaxID=2202339 RepID=UPI001FE92BE3|nr:epoxide hydrolase N-terminal domain-containing protein [Chitinophaga varians]
MKNKNISLKNKITTGLLLLATTTAFAQSSSNITSTAIRPYHVAIAEQQVKDLRQRISTTRWPEKETVADQSQGIQLDQLRTLVKYWGNGYDWHKAESKLNALPQFITRIDGLDIHFIHVRSKHKNAMPLIITHGWPGSVFEALKAIEPLTNPTKYGGKAEDAFDVVIPSMPG